MLVLAAAIHFATACVLAAFANWLGLRPWRQASDAHWTERARLLWPARMTALSNVLIIPILVDQAHRGLFPDASHPWAINGLASVLGVLLGSYPFDHAMFPELNFRKWQGYAIVNWGFQLGTWIALFAAISFMPAEPGPRLLAVTAIYLTLHFSIQFGLYLQYLRWTKFLKPAGRRLQRIVDEASARAGVTVRASWMLDTVQAQAYAFPTTNELLFSKPLLEQCEDEELSSICLHELAHLSESRFTLAGRLFGSLIYFPLIFIQPAVHLMGLPGFAVLAAACFGIHRFSRGLSHKMEQRADLAAIDTQANEGVYARALEKLYNRNQIPAVTHDRRPTHPHLYDRLVTAGITPDYEKPAAPSKSTGIGTAYGIALGIFFLVSAYRGSYESRRDQPLPNPYASESPLLHIQQQKLETQHLKFPVSPAE